MGQSLDLEIFDAGDARCEPAPIEGVASMNKQPLVAYYRVSTPAQRKSGLSLEGQRMAVRRYIDAYPGELIGEFTDVMSGKRDDRPQFQKALWLCRVYDAKLVVAHLDRMSRSFTLVAGLLESRVDFVAANMPYANRFTVHVLAAVAEYELRLMSERHKAACAAAKAHGKSVLNLRPGAYRPSREMIEARSRESRERADARARLFAPLLCGLRDQGATLSGIAAELTRMKIATPLHAPKWRREVVRRMFERVGEAKPKSGRGRNQRRSEAPIAQSIPLFLGSLNGLQL
jgi:DNA invertase Pin-like site-specific DNA recombinase